MMSEFLIFHGFVVNSYSYHYLLLRASSTLQSECQVTSRFVDCVVCGLSLTAFTAPDLVKPRLVCEDLQDMGFDVLGSG